MSFAMHINMERCTGCNNCVVSCPVNALELNTVDPASTLCAGCGVCVEACPYEVIRLVGPQDGPVAAKAADGATH